MPNKKNENNHSSRLWFRRRCRFDLGVVLGSLLFLLLALSTESSSSSSSSRMAAWQTPLTTTRTMTTSTSTTSRHMDRCGSSSLCRSRCWLIVDYDGTCTVQDTTPLLPQLAAVLQGQAVDSRRNTFQTLEDLFFRLYAAAKKETITVIMAPTTTTTAGATSSTTRTTLEQVLDALDDPSNAVTEKVSASRVLQGLHASSSRIQDVLQNANNPLQVDLRHQCLAVLQSALDKQYQLGVLSINWCPALIQATVVDQLVAVDTTTTTTTTTRPKIPIWSNVVNDQGIVDLQVPGAVAKRARIQALQNDNCAVVIYVGDSTTDLAALVQANVGILFVNEESSSSSSQSTLQCLCEHFHIALYPLRERARILSATTRQSPARTTVWTVQEWDEIGQFLQEEHVDCCPTQSR